MKAMDDPVAMDTLVVPLLVRHQHYIWNHWKGQVGFKQLLSKYLNVTNLSQASCGWCSSIYPDTLISQYYSRSNTQKYLPNYISNP